METIKHFLRTIDIFGITYSFRYKQKERYQTALGGFILLLFFTLVLILGIYYFIPFINMKNYTVVYYTMNLAATEEVNLFQSESNFAIGLTCDTNKNEKLSVKDLLDLKSTFILYEKQKNSSYFKHTKKLKSHQCDYNDFYNKYDNQYDYLGISKYECLENKEDIIQGIFTDQIFSYFEFTVQAKNDSAVVELDRFLYENDCKFQIVFTDIIIDLLNYKEPITQYLNQVFIQLNPTLFIKRNMFYMNQYFTNDDNMLFVFVDGEPKLKTLYSRYDEYFLYMGLERNKTRPYNYDKYAKLYMRADLKKLYITRRYQKVMEFYADASSFLIAIYEITYLILNFIDFFYAYHSLAQQLFFFKGIEEDNNYNIFNKKNQIQKLISLIDNNDKNNKIDEFENNPKFVSEKINKEMGLYKNTSLQTQNKKKTTLSLLKKPLQKESQTNPKENKPKKRNNKYKIFYKENSSEDYLKKFKNSHIQKNSENITIINLKNNEKILKVKNMDKSSTSSSGFHITTTTNNTQKIEYEFSILEIFITQFLSCFMCKNMKLKNDINENAYEMINQKLDVIIFIRNMILFDIMKQTVIDNERNDIINLICRPLISEVKIRKNESDDFYRNYKEEDFDKFLNNILDLVQKPEKSEKEKKLVSISKEHLKKFI